MADQFTRTNLSIQDLTARLETYVQELKEIAELRETEERYNRLKALRNTFRESMDRIVADFDNALHHERDAR
jgi:DNA repair ATPase RecN